MVRPVYCDVMVGLIYCAVRLVYCDDVMVRVIYCAVMNMILVCCAVN